MKNKILIMVSFLLLLTGCGSKELSNKDIEKKMKDLNFEMKYSEPEGEEKLSVLKMVGDDYELVYNTYPAWGISTDETTVMLSDQIGFTNEFKCSYNIKKGETEAYSHCSSDDITEIKKVKKLFKSFLKEVGITEKQFKSFAKYEIKKEKKNYVPSTAKDTEKSVEDLLTDLGFVLSDGTYVLNHDVPSFEKITPNAILIHVSNKQFGFSFSTGRMILIDWNKAPTEIDIAEKNDDGTMCVYDVNSHTWLSDSCGSEKELFYLDCYNAFLKFQINNEIFLS